MEFVNGVQDEGGCESTGEVPVTDGSFVAVAPSLQWKALDVTNFDPSLKFVNKKRNHPTKLINLHISFSRGHVIGSRFVVRFRVGDLSRLESSRSSGIQR